MPANAIFCPGCGRSVKVSEKANARLRDKVAGALAYLLLPAFVLLLIDPYNRNSFIRFHSIQSIGTWFAALLLLVSLRLFSAVLGLIPGLGILFIWLLWMLVFLALGTIWIVLALKAVQGERLELPLLGRFAAMLADEV